jgi:hypothetical protein
MDGASGILDNACEIKMQIKVFAYVARMTNDMKWVDRAWAEIQVGNFAIAWLATHSKLPMFSLSTAAHVPASQTHTTSAFVTCHHVALLA